MGGRRQRNLGRGLALGRGAAESGSGSGQDAGGLGAHAQHAPAARGQDLEVELVEADAELVAGAAQGLLDGLAGELAVCVAIGSHVSVVSLAGLRAGAYSAGQLRPPMPSAPPACAGWPPATCLHSAGSGMVTGNLGVWFWAKAGFQPNSGNIEPQPTIRNCWTIEKSEVAIQ